MENIIRNTVVFPASSYLNQIWWEFVLYLLPSAIKAFFPVTPPVHSSSNHSRSDILLFPSLLIKYIVSGAFAHDMNGMCGRWRGRKIPSEISVTRLQSRAFDCLEQQRAAYINLCLSLAESAYLVRLKSDSNMVSIPRNMYLLKILVEDGEYNQKYCGVSNFLVH